jgi:hypothetical protein
MEAEAGGRARSPDATVHHLQRTLSSANRCHFKWQQTRSSRKILANLLIVFEIDSFGFGNFAGHVRQCCQNSIAAPDKQFLSSGTKTTCWPIGFFSCKQQNSLFSEAASHAEK